MKNRLRKSMIIVLFTQVILFSIAIFGGKTIQRLSGEYLKILDSRVTLRKNYIQDEMLQKWSNITDFGHYVENEAKEMGIKKDLALIPELLETVVDRMVIALRQNGVTEMFVILEGEENHEGIYLRDLDPSFNAVDNSDILIERGSVNIARNIGVSLDSQWASNFDLLEEGPATEFYYKPFLAAQSYKAMAAKDLGYWSRPFRLSENDVEIITYSIPLLDGTGNPYGVIGVGITVDYLQGLLSYDELVGDKQGAYLLSIQSKDTGRYEKIVSAGPMYGSLVGNQDNINEEKGYENIYRVDASEDGVGKVYASTQHLNLYNANTPFENDSWSLTGFVEKQVLFKPIKQLRNSVILSLFISLCFGLVMVYLVGAWFMKPINKLMENVLTSTLTNPFRLTKTNILEIDRLGIAIELLNKKVADSASKLSQIISMVNVPIGAFEYNIGGNKVFCTDTLFDVLGIKKTDTINYVTATYFRKVIDKIVKEPETDLQNIYSYKKKDGRSCWLRMTTQTEDGKVLGVIEDVTDDVISKRRIEYERDHDVLTHLYNRRAFEVLAKKKMKEEILATSAFVMWDLDNLKYINDTYGHEYGDRYIQKAADVLKEFTMYNAIVARMSGDEFYTFVYGYSDKETLRKRIKEIQTSLYNTFLPVPDGEILRIRASAGIAWYPDDSKDYDELIRYSDFTMYEIKHKDKGNVGEFNRDSYNRDSILLHGKEELNHFIDQGLVKYAFQPIVDTKTGEIFAYEALMRPQTKKLSSPLDIIRLAQSQSKLYEIEKLTWFKAMEAFEEKIEYFGDAKIFINSIPNHVLSKVDIEAFEERFSRHLNRIVIEITENEQSDEYSTRTKKDMVARWGTHLALDDFGSGYNSEGTLLVLSPKFIKIDMSIIKGIDIDENRQKLLKNIISYASNRDIKIIAEGIETKGEMDKLIELGVDYMQGYYLGKPNLIPQPLSPEIK